MSGEELDRLRLWAERAERDARRLGMEDVVRLAVMTGLNPPERDEAITRLSDGELAFLFEMLSRPGELIAWGVRTGRIQTNPPGGQIILTTEVLAEIATVREVNGQEIGRRVFPA